MRMRFGFLIIVIVAAFVTCQAVCLSHAHCHEHIPGDFDHHGQTRHRDGYDGEQRPHDHGQDHAPIEQVDDRGYPAERNMHSCMDNALDKKILPGYFLETGADMPAPPAAVGRSPGENRRTGAHVLSPAARHGFTFVGRSPTIS